MMLLMKFDFDWPAGLSDILMIESVDARADARTHGRQLESHTINSSWVFGSGELK